MPLRRFTLAFLAVVLPGLLLIACGSADATSPTATEAPIGQPLAPDLVFAPLEDLQVGLSPDGRRLLFFTASIANIGDGPLLIVGSRDEDWALEQLIAYSEEGEERIGVPLSMKFGGDGHGHWHVEQAAQYRLMRVDAGPEEAPRFDEKAGFCFFDQAIYREEMIGDVTEPRHDTHDCGDEDARTSEMGLSVGWSDPYQWFLPGQSIDVTDAPDGRYRLEAIVDPDQLLSETNRDNNTTWVEFTMHTRAEDGLAVLELIEASQPY